MPSPAVSVVIPAYNASPFIAETLDSVLSQTFTDYEILVVNDGSPDTPALEEVLAPYRSRLNYLRQRNTGPSGARNLAIRCARGQYIALLDSDDIWLPTYLEEQLHRLQAEPDLDLLYSDGLIQGGPLDGRRLMAVTPSHPVVTTERLIAEQCTVLASCTVVRRRLLMNAGLFDERFRRSEDAHLWLRLALRGARIAWHPSVLVRHRRREGSLADDRVAMVKAYIDVLEDIQARYELTGVQRLLVQRQMARRLALVALDEGKQLFVAGRYAEAAAALARARNSEPEAVQQIRFALVELGVRIAPRLLLRAYELIHQPAVPVLR